MKAMRIKRFLCGALAFDMLLAAAGCAQRPQEPPHRAVSDPVGLAEALGAGGVTVTFRIRTA